MGVTNSESSWLALIFSAKIAYDWMTAPHSGADLSNEKIQLHREDSFYQEPLSSRFEDVEKLHLEQDSGINITTLSSISSAENIRNYSGVCLGAYPTASLAGRALARRTPLVSIDLTTDQGLKMIKNTSGVFESYNTSFGTNAGHVAARRFFSNMYENANGAAGAAYKAASSFASSAWGQVGWTTKVGLGVAAVTLTCYLAKKYLTSQAGINVVNNNYPVFNNNPTFKQDVHLHFPEGVKVHQKKEQDGVHFTIKKEVISPRMRFQEAVRKVIAINKRARAAAEAA